LEVKSKYISPLFDLDYFSIKYNTDVNLLPIEVIYNFLNKEDQFYFKPNAVFDPIYYIQNNPECDINPFLHFLITEKSKKSNPSLLFDTKYYYLKYNLESYPFSALHHYFSIGFRKNRNPNPLFDNQYVISRYYFSEAENPLSSYLSDNDKGINQTCEHFDGEFFKAKNIDKIKYDKSKTPLENFFLNCTNKSLVTCRKIDPALYIIDNPDVTINPTLHYILNNRKPKISNLISQPIRRQIKSASQIENNLSDRIEEYLMMHSYSQPFISPAFRLIRKIIEQIGQLKPSCIILSQRSDDTELFRTFTIRLKAVLEAYKLTEYLVLIPDDNRISHSCTFTHSTFTVDMHELEPKLKNKHKVKVLNNLLMSLKPRLFINLNTDFGKKYIVDFGRGIANYSSILDIDLIRTDKQKEKPQCKYLALSFKKYYELGLTHNVCQNLESDYQYDSAVLNRIEEKLRMGLDIILSEN